MIGPHAFQRYSKLLRYPPISEKSAEAVLAVIRIAVDTHQRVHLPIRQLKSIMIIRRHFSKPGKGRRV